MALPTWRLQKTSVKYHHFHFYRGKTQFTLSRATE